MFRKKFLNVVIIILLIIATLSTMVVESIGFPFAVISAFILNKWPKWAYYFSKKLMKIGPQKEDTKIYEWPLKVK